MTTTYEPNDPDFCRKCERYIGPNGIAGTHASDCSRSPVFSLDGYDSSIELSLNDLGKLLFITRHIQVVIDQGRM